MSKKIAIIGAGISGLSIGKMLFEKGFDVSIFEKSRGVGGRMSTRRYEDMSFDHGAQYFTIRTKEFKDFLTPYFEDGTIKEWKGKVITFEKNKKVEKRLWFEPHYVATPNMNSLCKKIASGLNVTLDCEVKPLERSGKKWLLKNNDKELGLFDHVISTAPPKQTSNLFGTHLSKDKILSTIEMQPCFALMIGFKEKINTNWMAAKVMDSKINWISINNSKPDRKSENTSFVVHASNSWSEENVNEPIESIQQQMLDEFAEHTKIDISKSHYISTHRWLYSTVSETEKNEFLLDTDNNLSACGDWCLTSRIEEAFTSARVLKNKITGIL